MKVTVIGGTTLQKAFRPEPLLQSPDTLEKSMPAADRKAYETNPLKLFEAAGGYVSKPTSLSFEILYQMSVKNSVVAAVLNTRINQVSTFTRPARFSPDGIGYVIRLRDPKAVPNKEQQETMAALELFLENCGYTDNSDRDDFDTFIRKITRDSLTYDQMCFEIVPDRRGKPAALYAVDAATIRAASEDFQPSDTMPGGVPKKSEEVAFVQLIDGEIKTWFTARELAFGVRNPRTNIMLQPYGFSELEMLIQQITSHLYAEEYNSKYFSQGGTTKGIINLKSDPNGVANREQLEAFKRQWRAQVNGMTGAWKTPVLQVPNGIEYINVNQSNRDMEYTQWVNYLINIVCAVYQIDPAEVNFANNGGAGGSQSVFETSTEQKLKNSKDKGLKPLLRFLESVINKWVISKFHEDYVFAFTGIDDQTESEQAELFSKQVRTFKTVNEIRKEQGLEPIDDGDVILDSSWLNYKTQQAMAGGMGGMPDMGGMEGETPEQPEGMEAPEGEETESSEPAEDYSAYLEQPEESGEESMQKSAHTLVITMEE